MIKNFALVALCLLTACAGGPHKPATHKTAVQWPGTHSAAAQRNQEQESEPYYDDTQVADMQAPGAQMAAPQAAPAQGTPAPGAPAPVAMAQDAGTKEALAYSASPAFPPSTTEGYLVASVDEVVPVDVQVLPKALNGLLPLTGSYQLKIRKVGGTPVGTFGCSHNAFDLHANDFSALSHFGYVTVEKLPPGNYEVYSYDVRWREGKDKNMAMTSAAPFSIPFTIEAGKTTYLGNFGAVGFKAKNGWGRSEPAGAYFVVANKAQRDIGIAKKKMPQIGPVSNATPDPATLNIPAFKATMAPAG